MTVAVGDVRHEGRLTAAVNDLIVIQGQTSETSLNLAAVTFVRSDRRAEFEGTSGERSASSFRAQLGRHEVDGTPVRLQGQGLDVTGVITASTDDHVLVRDSIGAEWGIPWSEISCAVSPI